MENWSKQSAGMTAFNFFELSLSADYQPSPSEVQRLSYAPFTTPLLRVASSIFAFIIFIAFRMTLCVPSLDVYVKNAWIPPKINQLLEVFVPFSFGNTYSFAQLIVWT